MSLGSLINKGKEAITNVANNAAQKYNDYKAANQEFQKVIDSSVPMTGFMLCENYDRTFNSYRKNRIVELIPSINRETAKDLDKTLNENIIVFMVFRSLESKTNKSFWFMLTNNGIYITDVINYKIYKYEEVSNLDVIVKGVMSQNVSFNNMAFNFEVTDTDMKKLEEYIRNIDARNNAINESLKYLCGKQAAKQYINDYDVGITVTTDNMIVLHEDNHVNEAINKKDITRVDVLSDNSTIMTRGVNENKILSAKQGCYTLALKIILTNGEKVITVLPMNALNSMYLREDTVYNNSIEFCKIVIEELLKRD